MINKIEIDLIDAEYVVYVGDEILRRLDEIILNHSLNKSFYFIVDDYIYEHYKIELQHIMQSLKAEHYVLKAGKSNKTFSSAMKVFSDLDKKNVSRDVTIVALGGGVIGDLSGFVASCWYRGVDLIHFPTTLLSAVDSCLGGKTAINFRHTVNAIGTYHHPSSIMIDTDLLLKLPKREIASGFGEIIKYAALGSKDIIKLLEDEDVLDAKKLSKFISLSLKEKEKFVKGDIKESSNRLFLNFGHTIGHAIEFSTIFNGSELLRHGEGVALGMVAIFKVCIKLGLLEDSDLKRLKSLLTKYDLPTEFLAERMSVGKDVLIEAITDLTFKDKKRTKNNLRLVVLDGWGNPKLHVTSDRDLIREGIFEVIK
jgi:3-dehydroquinate synthase